MERKYKTINLIFLTVILLLLIPLIQHTVVYIGNAQSTFFFPPANTVVIPVTTVPEPSQGTLQLQTFPFITTTPTLTPTPTPKISIAKSPIPTSPQIIPPSSPSGPVPVTTPIIGGPQGPSDPYYCIDDVDPDMCDDNSSYLVPKGSGGSTGTCGSIIENTHKLVMALPQVMKGLRDSLTVNVQTACGTTGPSSNYVSTFLVIDAYNLSGFNELSKTNPSHVSPTSLLSWWQSQPASSGYVFIPYSPIVMQEFASGQKNLTGCVMFLQTASSYHIGIVNVFELYGASGDGVISILQSGTRMYIDRFPVVGWAIENTSTNQTNTNGVVGFGCHT